MNKELLLYIETKLNKNGPWKLNILHGETLIKTIKIRMKDDITYLVCLFEGDFLFQLTKNNQIFNEKSFFLRNFENGSQLKIKIDDDSIEFDEKGVVFYRSNEEIFDEINEIKSGFNKKNKKNKKKKALNENSEKTIKDSVLNGKINENFEKIEKVSKDSVLNEKINENTEKIENISDLPEEISLKDFIEKQIKINSHLQNEISELKQQIMKLNNQS